MNLKAIYRLYWTPWSWRDLCYYLIRKRYYRIGKTAWCRWKLRCIRKFTAASHGELLWDYLPRV